jgi:hypothetical protein
MAASGELEEEIEALRVIYGLSAVDVERLADGDGGESSIHIDMHQNQVCEFPLHWHFFRHTQLTVNVPTRCLHSPNIRSR